jgi:uncharacterized protein (UPF0248 family)
LGGGQTAVLAAVPADDEGGKMTYYENPKTKGSGIVCCIPQTDRCPMNCDDCFFQSGRSYLEPLAEKLPNIPDYDLSKNVVRINDGNDSNVNPDKVKSIAQNYPMHFYNTSIPKVDHFDAPVVLTLNPGKMTDKEWHKLDPVPGNLMFVRLRINTWNLDVCDDAVKYYTEKDIAVVLTFMAYYQEESIPYRHKNNYMFRKRTLNSYYAITTKAWRKIMRRYDENIRVYSCGKIEGEKGKTACKYCGNCLREYFLTMEKMKAVLNG